MSCHAERQPEKNSQDNAAPFFNPVLCPFGVFLLINSYASLCKQATMSVQTRREVVLQIQSRFEYLSRCTSAIKEA
ncbi:hypothetical protein L209DRAFT_310217 [Thermothelomyces heterothallicus CBS 203.75]